MDEFPGKLPEEHLAEVVRQPAAEPQGGSVGRTFIFVPIGYNIHDRPPSINNGWYSLMTTDIEPLLVMHGNIVHFALLETATKVSCSVEIMKVMDVNEVNEVRVKVVEKGTNHAHHYGFCAGNQP